MFLLVVLGAALGRLQTLSRDHGRVDLVSSAVLTLIRPFGMPLGRMMVATSEFGSGVFNVRSLAAENDRLKSQLIGYEAYAQRVDLFQQEIDGYRKQLALAQTARNGVNLDVIGISLTDGLLILDGGSEMGIKPDQAVVNGDGLVGIVQSVTKGESRVALLTAYNVRIFGMDGDRKPPEEGLLVGTGEPTLTMRMLNPKDPVASGDKILTTLKSKNIPGGLVVGRVISVDADPYYGTTRLTVDPAVNLGSVHEVQVLR